MGEPHSPTREGNTELPGPPHPRCLFGPGRVDECKRPSLPPTPAPPAHRPKGDLEKPDESAGPCVESAADGGVSLEGKGGGEACVIPSPLPGIGGHLGSRNRSRPWRGRSGSRVPPSSRENVFHIPKTSCFLFFFYHPPSLKFKLEAVLFYLFVPVPSPSPTSCFLHGTRRDVV